MKTVSPSTVIGFFFAICLGLKLELCQADEEQTCVVNEEFGEKICSQKESSNFGDAMLEEIEWLRQADGVFHEHQEVRFEDPDDPNSGYGVFATELIPNGELLTRVPWHLIIKPPKGLDYQKSGLTCETVDALIKEMRLGDESDFAPFVNRLMKNPPTKIPETWSYEGLKMLKTLVGNDLPPQGVDGFWMKDEWFGTCQGSSDPLEVDAAIHVLTRADDDLMVPIYDLYNHRNGKWFNAEIHSLPGTDFRIMATRDIQAGEQIYHSYSQCRRCRSRMARYYGTPEFLRDYGFVESYPRRWKLSEEIKFDLDLAEDGQTLVGAWKDDKIPDSLDMEFLTMEERRLSNISEKWADDEELSERVPENEWDTLWDYLDALLEAVAHGIHTSTPESVEYEDEEELYERNHAACFADGHYINLDGFKWEDHSWDKKSLYQQISYYEKPQMEDKCFDLDDTVQICADYRPHYHEPFVHFPAAFLTSLKRVVFVGGGDSMLLHEILKYPTIELVMGLELDQKVVRNSFKHFHTQPHFDDERVQWWFGDATKSLNILPKEFFGSFDLVLVDLSETVMSFTVTEHLDMLEALALLLTPEGIFVKNERYFEKLSTIFDYVVQLYLEDTPMICKQDFIMASNKVDFLKPNFDLLKKYNIETLLYKPLENLNDHYNLFWDYAKNSAIEGGKCNKIEESNVPKREQRSGLLMILDVEDVVVPLNSSKAVEETLLAVLTKAGLSIVTTLSEPSDFGGVTVVIVMREGFVTAHTWPDHNYCSLDIQLWGVFDSLDGIKSSLVTALGSKEGSWQAFRIVAGGMLEAQNWEDEQKKLGPVIVNNRDCDPPATEEPVTYDTVLGAILNESVSKLVKNKDALVVVICGDISTPWLCSSHDVIEENKDISNFVALWSCPVGDKVKDDYDHDDLDNIVYCGVGTTFEMFESAVEYYGKIGTIIVDKEASPTLIEEVALLWNSKEDAEEVLNPNNVIIVPTEEEGDPNTARSALLQRSRRRVISETISMVEITVGDNYDNSISVGFTGSEYTGFLSDVVEVAANIKSNHGMHAEVSDIKSRLKPDPDWPFPHEYVMEDYDRLPGLKQFSNQNPLASQSIFQFQKEANKETGNQAEIVLSDLKGAFDGALKNMGLKSTKLEVITDVGAGALIVAILYEGHAIALWDGGLRVDLNILTYDQDVDHQGVFANHFSETMKDMNLMLRDEQPRGTGHVINLMMDIGTRTPGCWDTYQWCSLFAEEGDCGEREWMDENCKKTCGLCL